MTTFCQRFSHTGLARMQKSGTENSRMFPTPVTKQKIFNERQFSKIVVFSLFLVYKKIKEERKNDYFLKNEKNFARGGGIK